MWFYRLLLHLYPKSFRLEYATEMEQVFLQNRRNASTILEKLFLWPEAIFDVVTNAIRVHTDILVQDLRYTTRTLWRSPGFALTAILLAGLGIGVTTAVFTLTDHVLIRALPYPESNQLVQLWERPEGYTQNEVSPPNFQDWKSASTSFQDIGVFHDLSVNLVGHGQPQRLDGAAISSNLFRILQVQPVLGRLFTEKEDSPETQTALLLSYGLWQTSFAGDQSVLGTTVRLNDEPYVIVGVMPKDFNFPTADDQLWTTMRLSQGDKEDRNNNFLHVIARLKSDVSVEKARKEMDVIAARLEKEYPQENENEGITVNRLKDQVSNRARLLIKVLFGAAICVLLIACSNLANLLLARGLIRQKEVAVRSSLGAGKERLVRQMLTESLVLSTLGGTLGILAAMIALPLLTRLVPQTLPIGEPSIDLRVLIFASILTVITAIAFGIVPSLRAQADDHSAALREGSRSGLGGHKERLRSSLVIAEVTISVVLLVGAGLMIRALWRIQQTDPGFNTQNVLTLNTPLSLPKYSKTETRAQFYSRVISSVRELPGVKDAAFISNLPIVRTGGIWPVNVQGHAKNPGDPDNASLRYVTPGFFRTMQIPFQSGRDISESDTIDSAPIAVVSKSFVEKYWPNQDALGKEFEFAFAKRRIVGIVGDIRVRGLERKSEPQVYLSYRQVPDNAIIGYIPKDLAIRSAVDPLTLVASVRQIIQSVDPEQPISDVRTLEDIVSSDTSSRQTQVKVLGSFAIAAILLAAIGIHGLLSFSVTQRNQEIAVRMAVGAQPNHILKMIFRDGAFLAAVGVIVGASLGYAAGRIMEGLLVGIRPGDALTFLTAIGITVLMALAGILIPAFRAVRINPATAMRAE
jgi:putative ABC transport system permease protein